MRKIRRKRVVIDVKDDSTVPDQKQAVELSRLAEVDELRELSRIHSLFFRRRYLPAVRRPDRLRAGGEGDGAGKAAAHDEQTEQFVFPPISKREKYPARATSQSDCQRRAAADP